MAKISTENLNLLLDSVLEKRQWKQTDLAKELEITPETISRWRAGEGIGKRLHNRLLDLDQSLPAAPDTLLKIPFSITVPRDSLRVSLDKNGDFLITGFVLPAMGSKKEN